MSLPIESKLNFLLQNWPKGTVVVDSWLKKMGVYKQLKQKYIRSKWLKSIGRGAVSRVGDSIDWKGGLYAIQTQMSTAIHIGGKTALEMQGEGHFIKFSETSIFLYSSKNARLPSWFLHYPWGVKIHFNNARFLKSESGIRTIPVGDFELNISVAERAILEVLYQVPMHQSIEESYYLMEGMIGLRPDLVQNLLEACTSIKVKRLFLCLAEKLNLPWFSRLNLQKINLGQGKRSIIKNGILDKKYFITIPRSLAEHD